MNQPTIYLLPGGLSITVQPGSIESDLRDYPDPRNEAWDAATDGLEALLLACASAGIDMNTAAMHEAVETAVMAIAEEHGND